MSKQTVSVAPSDVPASARKDDGKIEKAIAKASDWKSAELVGRTLAINKPREELYAFWRDFENLPHFMENIEHVDVIDEKRSHWRVLAPAGRTVEWDSFIVDEREGELIAWESEPGADIKHKGMVEFRDGPPGRGTTVRVTLAYEPPGGDLGEVIAKLFQKEPQIQAARDLRRFKQLMETGEIPTAEPPHAAPRA